MTTSVEILWTSHEHNLTIPQKLNSSHLLPSASAFPSHGERGLSLTVANRGQLGASCALVSSGGIRGENSGSSGYFFPCRLVNSRRRFGDAYCLHFQHPSLGCFDLEVACRKLIRNVYKYYQLYGITSHKTRIFMNAAVKNFNLGFVTLHINREILRHTTMTCFLKFKCWNN